MARWTTNASGRQLQKKHMQRVKQSMKVYTGNKYMKGFTRLPQEAREAPAEDAPKSQGAAPSHHLNKDDVAHFYAREQLRLEQQQRKQQSLMPRTLKGRGFSAVAAYAQDRDYMKPDAVEPKGPVKPLKYDYTRVHPSWEAKREERQRQANVFEAFKGVHLRVPEDPGCRLYIRGFPGRMANDSALRELFAPFGAIDNMKLHWSSSLRSHFAFVDFDQTPDAERAANQLNGTKADGHELVVQVKGKPVGPPPTSNPVPRPAPVPSTPEARSASKPTHAAART
eukprot:GGOE01049527.1.p1 GENE.GGOE01049527.1~~GGOE01049527.1.p1  ORF type:complete len:282 (+),score=60.38 GGOE01049527.1:51-896(+)